VNGDGYNDIALTIRYHQEAFLFNPGTKTFMDTPSCTLYPNWTLLDSEHRIFCDLREGKMMRGDLNSTLYTFNGFEKRILYRLYLNNEADPDMVTHLELYQCMDGDEYKCREITTEKLKRPIDLNAMDSNGHYATGTDEYFDYRIYWKQRYKQLLHIQ
jgi:hypothetical protein